MTGRLVFTLLGTGSSGGVPRITGDWGACDPNEPKNRRTRCSALVELYGDSEEPTRVLIDTSPDMREQLLTAGAAWLDALVFTHDHADQTHGLDDVRVIAYTMQRQLPAYMDAATAETLVPKFAYCFEGKGGYPPIVALQPFIQAYTPLTLQGAGGPLEMLPIDQEHGRIRSLGFRIGDLAYCNDLNDLPTASLAHLEGLDTLVIDALRYTPHPTHAHLDQTLGWIAQLKPKRAVLTNMHIDLDYETLRRELPDGVVPGYDGMKLELPI